jgi:hypothetical protein
MPGPAQLEALHCKLQAVPVSTQSMLGPQRVHQGTCAAVGLHDMSPPCSDDGLVGTAEQEVEAAAASAAQVAERLQQGLGMMCGATGGHLQVCVCVFERRGGGSTRTWWVAGSVHSDQPVWLTLGCMIADGRTHSAASGAFAAGIRLRIARRRSGIAGCIVRAALGAFGASMACAPSCHVRCDAATPTPELSTAEHTTRGWQQQHR